MTIQRIAAFSNGNSGGNPAGVYISDRHPSETDMQRIAAEVGYSETAFTAPVADATNNSYRVRYFAPETEVPGSAIRISGTARIIDSIDA